MLGYTLSSFMAKTKLWVWEDGSYNLHSYIAEDLGGLDSSFIGKKWLDNKGNPSNFSIDAGKAFWIDTPMSAEIIFLGQVFTENDYSIDIETGLNLVSNPFPVLFNVHNINSDNLLGYTASSFVAKTKLWAWEDGSYNLHSYIAEDLGGMDSSFIGKKWLDNKGNPSILTIDVGQGFWIDTPANATLVFTLP